MNNDRFKFRVWDNKNNEYVPEGETCDVHCLLWRDGTLDCGISYDDGYAGGIDWVKTEDAIIEQCTGVKDKNGKLIYEGDIIHFYVEFDDGMVIDRDIVVEWDEGNCGFDFWQSPDCISSDGEIIGNIHDSAAVLKPERSR